MKIFIDDERFPITDGWIICRTKDDFVRTVFEYGFPDYISFDHDLGDNQPTGFDIAKWIVEYDLDYNVIGSDFAFYVHSQNPIGKINIEEYLNQYLRTKNP